MLITFLLMSTKVQIWVALSRRIHHWVESLFAMMKGAGVYNVPYLLLIYGGS